MATTRKAKIPRRITAKAREVLKFAEQRAKEVADSFALSNSVFAANGEASRAFPTAADRTAFCQTPEYRRILKLRDTLPWPPLQEGVVDLRPSVNGHVNVSLPSSVHAALQAEAKAKGISLEQLCADKLIAGTNSNAKAKREIA